MEKSFSKASYAIAWIVALSIERAAAEAQFDDEHEEPADFEQNPSDTNSYSWGCIDNHNVVIASPSQGDGITNAAMTASNLLLSLPNIKIGLLVGIGSGIPRHLDEDIRLGDVVVSRPGAGSGSIIQFDYGKARLDGEWEPKRTLNNTPIVLLEALSRLQSNHIRGRSKIQAFLVDMLTKNPYLRNAKKKERRFVHQGFGNDQLFSASYSHVEGPTCDKCDPYEKVQRDKRLTIEPLIHYGTIASGNVVVKDASFRDKIAEFAGSDCICIEMEAAGLMKNFPCLVIRGICDYADSHQNKRWQPYASATAAAYAKELLGYIPMKNLEGTQSSVQNDDAIGLDVPGDSIDDESDIESVFSITSLPSSVSSVADLVSIAVPEWVTLLLDDKVMKELFPIALSKVGPRRFPRNLARFLKSYGQNLKAEVSSEVQRQVPHFVHQSADRTATEITRSLLLTQNTPTPWSQVEDLKKSEQIDQWLASQQAIGEKVEADINEGADIDANLEPNDPDAPQLQNLKEVKDFMVSAVAFSTLQLEFRSWLKLDQTELEEDQKSSAQSKEMETLEQTIEVLHKNKNKKESDNGQSSEEDADSIPTTIDPFSVWPLDGTTVNLKSNSSTILQASTQVTTLEEEKWTFGWWQRLKAAFSPPKPGYKRLFYTCSCGDITYFDARETSPGGIEALRRKLRASAFRAAAGRGTSSATAPRVPLPAHSRSGNPTEPRAPQQISAVRRSSTPEPPQVGSTSSQTPVDQNQEVQFLLLCINAKQISVLTQLEVGSISCDEYLFREIRNVYEKITDNYAWKPYMLLPQWLRKFLSDTRFAAGIWQTFCNIRIHRISSGDFVRFQLVPIRNTAHPTWFTLELPPETEVIAQRYIYEPLPMRPDTDNIPLAHLLKPGEHYDGFWLSTFPKKLREELQRPAGTRRPIIGWGIRINQSLNWTIALSTLLLLLILISIVVVVYAVAAGDASAAFGLGAYLAALLTVWLTYHYFSWKEAL